jgi:hypothetical protein
MLNLNWPPFWAADVGCAAAAGAVVGLAAAAGAVVGAAGAVVGLAAAAGAVVGAVVGAAAAGAEVGAAGALAGPQALSNVAPTPMPPQVIRNPRRVQRRDGVPKVEETSASRTA